MSLRGVFFFALCFSGIAARANTCETHSIHFSGEVDWSQVEPLSRLPVAIADAVWSANGRFVYVIDLVGRVFIFEGKSGAYLGFKKVKFPPESEVGKLRVLLGARGVVAIRAGVGEEKLLYLAPMNTGEDEVALSEVLAAPILDKGLDVDRIRLNAAGDLLLAELSDFGKRPQHALFAMGSPSEGVPLISAIDVDESKLFADDFSRAGVDTRYAIPWFQRLGLVSDDLSLYLLGGLTNISQKVGAEAAIGDLLKGQTLNRRGHVLKNFEVPMRRPSEHEGSLTRASVSPSGKFLILRFPRYNSRYFRLEHGNDVEVVPVQNVAKRWMLPAFKDEVFLGTVDHSPDWVVYMHMVPNRFGSSKEGFPMKGDHFVIRSLHNPTLILAEVSLEDEGAAQPDFLMGSYDGHLTSPVNKDRGRARREGISQILTHSFSNLMKFSVSPDRGRLLILRHDTRDPKEHILSLKTFKINVAD